jgi:hypothetical protein
LEIVVEYIIVPQADSKRRDDFIDNSFGSTFSTNASVGYFDTDEIRPGLYKAASNLFENCFFNYILVKAVIILELLMGGPKGIPMAAVHIRTSSNSPASKIKFPLKLNTALEIKASCFMGISCENLG